MKKAERVINLLPSQKRRGAVSRERGSRGRVGIKTVTLLPTSASREKLRVLTTEKVHKQDAKITNRQIENLLLLSAPLKTPSR